MTFAPLLIFALTYFVLAIGRLPGFRIHRTGAAIIGASLLSRWSRAHHPLLLLSAMVCQS